MSTALSQPRTACPTCAALQRLVSHLERREKQLEEQFDRHTKITADLITSLKAAEKATKVVMQPFFAYELPRVLRSNLHIVQVLTGVPSLQLDKLFLHTASRYYNRHTSLHAL